MNNTHRAQVVTPAEWEAARVRLLTKEQELTRARDALAAQRRRIPWLKMDHEYAFDGPNGTARLLDLFEGRRQLLLYRAFFEPDVDGWPDRTCVGYSLMADQVADLAHLHARQATLGFASRAPQPDIERMRARMGWAWPWYTITNFINAREHEPMGTTWGSLDLTALGRQEDREDSPDGYPPRYRDIPG